MDKLANTFGMSPLHTDVTPAPRVSTPSNLVEYIEPSTGEVMEVSNIDKALLEANEDYVSVRQSIKEMILDSMDVFAVAKLVVEQGKGDAKQIEAFAKMMDTIVRANKELMNIHKDMFGLQPPEKEAVQEADTINNVFFTGNAAELFRELKRKGVANLPREED